MEARHLTQSPPCAQTGPDAFRCYLNENHDGPHYNMGTDEFWDERGRIWVEDDDPEERHPFK